MPLVALPSSPWVLGSSFSSTSFDTMNATTTEPPPAAKPLPPKPRNPFDAFKLGADHWKAGDPGWIYAGPDSDPEVAEWVDHCLDVLPPAEFQGRGSFLMGEPYTHTDRDEPVYTSVRVRRPSGAVWTRLETVAMFLSTPNRLLPEPPAVLARFTKLRADRHADRDGWSWVFVIGYTGELETRPDDPQRLSPEETARVLDFCADHDFHAQRPGLDGMGPFDPLLDIFWDRIGNTLVVRQSGGLDH